MDEISVTTRTPSRRSRSGSETRKAQKLFAFRVDEAWLSSAEAAALQAGLSVGGYLRSLHLAKSSIVTRRRPTPSAAWLAKMHAELGRHGSNLNQLARRFNAGEFIEADELASALRTAEALYRDIQKRLKEGE